MNRLLPSGVIFDAAGKQRQLAGSENLIAEPDFWNNPEKSQKVMQDRKRLEEAIENDTRISGFTSDIETLFELGREGEDVSGEIERSLTQFSEILEKLETGMLMAGENDARPAIMTIHPAPAEPKARTGPKC